MLSPAAWRLRQEGGSLQASLCNLVPCLKVQDKEGWGRGSVEERPWQPQHCGEGTGQVPVSWLCIGLCREHGRRSRGNTPPPAAVCWSALLARGAPGVFGYGARVALATRKESGRAFLSSSVLQVVAVLHGSVSFEPFRVTSLFFFSPPPF